MRCNVTDFCSRLGGLGLGWLRLGGLGRFTSCAHLAFAQVESQKWRRFLGLALIADARQITRHDNGPPGDRQNTTCQHEVSTSDPATNIIKKVLHDRV